VIKTASENGSYYVPNDAGVIATCMPGTAKIEGRDASVVNLCRLQGIVCYSTKKAAAHSRHGGPF
jgi:hypothetical protein